MSEHLLSRCGISDKLRRLRAISSAVEHCLHTAGVTGSKPVSPTISQAILENDLLRKLIFCHNFATLIIKRPSHSSLFLILGK